MSLLTSGGNTIGIVIVMQDHAFLIVCSPNEQYLHAISQQGQHCPESLYFVGHKRHLWIFNSLPRELMPCMTSCIKDVDSVYSVLCLCFGVRIEAYLLLTNSVQLACERRGSGCNYMQSNVHHPHPHHPHAHSLYPTRAPPQTHNLYTTRAPPHTQSNSNFSACVFSAHLLCPLFSFLSFSLFFLSLCQSLSLSVSLFMTLWL